MYGDGHGHVGRDGEHTDRDGSGPNRTAQAASATAHARSADRPRGASCSVTYTPSAIETVAPAIFALYPGDSSTRATTSAPSACGFDRDHAFDVDERELLPTRGR